jgi:hypothetical protein
MSTMNQARPRPLVPAVTMLLFAASIACQGSGGSAPSGGQGSGTVTGTFAMGSSSPRLTHAYAFPEDPGADPEATSYRILVTDRPLSADAVKYAATAGRDDGDRQQLAVELAGDAVQGIEAVVAIDNRVVRVNVYGPDAAMGMMLLAPTAFEHISLDAGSIQGRLLTEGPIEDGRIGKTVQYDVTFSAPVHR